MIFHSTKRSLLVSIYLLGFGPSQFLYGPISDALGRKKVLMTGLLIALSGLVMIITLSDSFTGMVMGRFLQGLGTGCCAVLARASTRDRFSGAELPLAMSYIAMAASLTPLMAPVIGGFINFHFGWTMVFTSLLGYVSLVWIVIAFRFKETVTQTSKVPSPKKMAQQYWQLLTSSYFMSFASIGWLNFSLMITTVSVMPFIMQNQIGMTSDEYAMWALIPALGMLVGTTLTNRVRPKIGTQKMLFFTPVLHSFAALWLFFCPVEPLVPDARPIFDDPRERDCPALLTGNGDAALQKAGWRRSGYVGRRADDRFLYCQYGIGETRP